MSDAIIVAIYCGLLLGIIGLCFSGDRFLNWLERRSWGGKGREG